jgi:hypothetical protein
MPAKGTYLAVAGFGAIFLWSGLTGKSWSSVLRNVISGKNPSQAAATQQIQALNVQDVGSSSTGTGGGSAVTPSNIPTTPGSTAAYKTFAMSLMISHGWGLGQQWTDFQWVVDMESGWNNNAVNSSSGAYGIAQALGHGTATTKGTVTNEYGNFGTSDAVCKSANSGNGFSQLIWMCNYIAQAYGNPSNVRSRYNKGY